MKRAEFWVIVSLIVVLMGLILSMNVRMANMATKDDIVALKAEIKDVRDLLISHIMASHPGHTHSKHGKPVANKTPESKKHQKEPPPQDPTQSRPLAKKAQ